MPLSLKVPLSFSYQTKYNRDALLAITPRLIGDSAMQKDRVRVSNDSVTSSVF